jgi:hypothetical protein
MTLSRLAVMVQEPGAEHPPGWRPLLNDSGWPMPHPHGTVNRKVVSGTSRSRVSLGLLLLLLLVLVLSCGG